MNTPTTPQAAQVLSEQDMLDCLREFTHEVPTRLPMGWSMAFRAAEKRILAKLQAAPQAAHSPVKGYLSTHCPYCEQEFHFEPPQAAQGVGEVCSECRGPLGAHDRTCSKAPTPSPAVGLTDEQRAEVFRSAERRMVYDSNLSWRNAIIDEVERLHGIPTGTASDGGEG
jgi:hypothetical protein